MPEHDEMDRLLDSALSTYATPRPGLEERVLRSLAVTENRESANRRPRATRQWLLWAVAVPIAAAIVLFLLLGPQTPTPRSNDAQRAPHAQLPASPSVTSESSPFQVRARAVHPLRRHASPATTIAIRRDLPRQNIFPSPQPLSPEEQALAALAAHAPEPVRQSLIDAQVSDAPITISAIEIQPLKMPDLGQN